MLNFVSYRKLVTLKNGRRVALHFPHGQDWENLIRLFQEAPHEDTRFLKEILKEPGQISDLQKDILNRSTIPLMAEDLDRGRPVAAAHLKRGRDAHKHIGDIRHIFVARSFQNQGLGSLMLEELLNLAVMENLRWLKTEVVVDHKNAFRAFLSKGFEVKVILDDFFLSEDGETYDVALMTRPLLGEHPSQGEGEF
jgi:GNAT superfamily N-acetyltransferase